MGLAAHSKIGAIFTLAARSPRINRRYQSHSGTFSLQKPIKLKVGWARYRSQQWCRLNTLNLEKVNAHGVYIIWDPSKGNAIQIGHGNIADQVQSARNTILVTQFGEDLRVTWARVPHTYREGVVRYLYEQFSPMISNVSHQSLLVQVNHPGKS